MNAPAHLPIRGLPAPLPPGERLLWQGAPDLAPFARSAFHVRAVAIYFALLAVAASAMALVRHEVPFAAGATALGGMAACGLLLLMAWAAARSTVYTVTDRRIVLRIGVALPKSINLPLAKVAAIDLSDRGDIVLRMAEAAPLGWLTLWPHVRPWQVARPQPMLRCLPDGPQVARMIADACTALAPELWHQTPAAAIKPAPMPVREAVAA